MFWKVFGHFLFENILNLNFTFAVCRKCVTPLYYFSPRSVTSIYTHTLVRTAKIYVFFFNSKSIFTTKSG